MTQQIVFSVSAAVGSGKTTAIRDLAQSGDHHQILYVANTIVLLEQTKQVLEDAGVSTQLLTSNEDVRATTVQERATVALKTAYARPRVLLITQKTLLNVLGGNIHPDFLALWTLIIDEEINLIEEITVKTTDAQSMKPLRELIDFGGETLHIADAHAEKATAVVEHTANEDNLDGRRVRTLLQSIVSPVYAVFGEMNDSGDRLEANRLIRPQVFLPFKQTIIIAAIFEQTITHAVWAAHYGVRFEKFAPIYRRLKAVQSHDVGHRMTIRYMLNDADRASMNILQTVQDGQTKSVIFRILDEIRKHWSDGNFCYSTNKKFSNPDNSSAMFTSLPNTAALPPMSHGLNQFQGYHRIAALAATQPSDTLLRPLSAMSGQSYTELRALYRLQTVYQTVGRCSIRNTDIDTPVEVIVLDKTAADQLALIFKGARVLGQLGSIQQHRTWQSRPDGMPSKDWKNAKRRWKALKPKIDAGEPLTEKQAEFYQLMVDLGRA